MPIRTGLASGKGHGRSCPVCLLSDQSKRHRIPAAITRILRIHTMNTAHWLALTQTAGFGGVTVRRLLERFGGATAPWPATSVQ